MKALINKKTIIIASASLLIALIAFISVNAFNSAGPVTGFANTITRPVRSLASSVAGAFSDIYAAMYRYDELERRYEELLNTIAELHYDYRESTELAKENNQLRSLLDFSRRHGDLTNVQASFSGWTSDNWTHTFTINRGYANSNIAEGMGVSTEAGILIGQILSVGATQSTVITVIDTRFSASVFIGGQTIEDSDGTALALGDFTQMRNGLLIINFIDDNVVVNQGSHVVTSGHGGVFPPGLLVGVVVSVHNHASGIGRYATVRPSSPLEAFSEVYVITGYDDTVERESLDEPEDLDEPENFVRPDDIDRQIDLEGQIIDFID